MSPYLIARKLVQVIILILLMAVVIFVVYRLMPGNPAQLLTFGATKHGVSQQKIHDIEMQLGLAGGKWNFANFLTYMKDMLTFNFGFDYYQGLTVWQIISQALPYTMLLFGTASVLSFIIGIPMGIMATWFRGSKKEVALVGSANILNAIPFFVLAIVLILYLTAYYPIFPVRSNFPITYLTQPSLFSLGQVFYYMMLPLVTLVIIEAEAHLLTTRAAMVGILGEDYIATARAKGVAERSLMFHHAARNAMIPISTRMALEFALLMSGAVIVEIIFSWPGMGHLLYQATLTLDYPLAEGALFVISLVTIITYAFVDFIHAWLDPRIKL